MEEKPKNSEEAEVCKTVNELVAEIVMMDDLKEYIKKVIEVLVAHEGKEYRILLGRVEAVEEAFAQLVGEVEGAFAKLPPRQMSWSGGDGTPRLLNRRKPLHGWP